MNQIKPLACFFLVLLPILLLAQQTSTIEGFVFDQQTQLPLENVQISLQPSGQGAVTDEMGYFVIRNVSSGKITLEARFVGYQTYRQKLNTSIKTNLEIKLQPEMQQLQEVEIREKAFQRQSYPIDRIDKIEIRQFPARDAGDFLRKEPNIAGIRKGAVGIDPVLRGNRYKQINVVVNDAQKIEGGCPNRMDPAISHIDMEDIHEIEILKGPYALQYGPNFGGVINLKTINPFKADKFTTDITAIKGFESNWNGNKEHLSVTGGNKDFFISLSGNHKKYENYTAGNGKEIRSSFEKYNYGIQMGISPSERQQIILSMDNSYGRNISFPALPMDERSDDTRLLNFSYNIKNLNGTFEEISVKAYHSKVHHIMDNKERPFSDTVVAVSDLTAVNYGGRLQAALKFGNQKILVGLDRENILKDGERRKYFILQPNLPLKTENLWKEAEISNTGFYLIWNHTYSSWELSIGGRLDYNQGDSDGLSLQNMMGDVMYANDETSSSFTNISANAGALWNINRKFSMGLSLGRGVRSPGMVERFIILLPVGYDRYDYLGNPDLKPEANHEADLKFLYEDKRTGALQANLFFSYVSDYISGQLLPPAQVKPQTADVLGVKQFQNLDHVYLYGFELNYSSPVFYGFSLGANAGITRGINPEAEKYIITNGEVTGKETISNDPLPEIPPFEANLKLNYNIIDQKLDISLSSRMVAAQNQISEAYYEESTPGFVLADFKVNYIFNRNLRVNAGINNIFDKAYYEHLNRRIIGSNLPLYEPGRVFYANLIFNI